MRTPIKRVVEEDYTARRREEVSLRQRFRRMDMVQLRRFALESLQDETLEQIPDRKRRKTRLFLASQFMVFEWMNSAPSNLGTDFLIVARPEGIRCLMVANHGKSITRESNGS